MATQRTTGMHRGLEQDDAFNDINIMGLEETPELDEINPSFLIDTSNTSSMLEEQPSNVSPESANSANATREIKAPPREAVAAWMEARGQPAQSSSSSSRQQAATPMHPIIDDTRHVEIVMIDRGTATVTPIDSQSSSTAPGASMLAIPWSPFHQSSQQPNLFFRVNGKITSPLLSLATLQALSRMNNPPSRRPVRSSAAEEDSEQESGSESSKEESDKDGEDQESEENNSEDGEYEYIEPRPSTSRSMLPRKRKKLAEQSTKPDNSSRQKSSLNTVKGGSKFVECPKCGCKFPLQVHLSRHLQAHARDEKQNPFSCNFCSTGYSNKSALIVHIVTQHCKKFRGTFQCAFQECKGKHTFSSNKNVQSHLRSNHFKTHPLKTEKVPESSMKAPSSSQKRQEGKDETTKIAPGKSESTRCPGHQCQICDGSFVTEAALREHFKKAHPHSKPFQCALCGLGLCKKNSLVQHLAYKHSMWGDQGEDDQNTEDDDGEKTISCPFCICTRNFKKKLDLRRHIVECHPDWLSN